MHCKALAGHRLGFEGFSLTMNGLEALERLSALDSGEAAAIVSIAASQTSAKRLADMGFVRGAVVEMIRTGSPCLVRIGATCVGLGADHQRSIGVQRT